MVKKKLKLTDTRDSFKPFSYPEFFDLWLKHEQIHWIYTAVPMQQDVKDWKKLDENKRNFLTQILRLFTQSDVDVAGAYVNNYLPLFPQPEVRMMLLGFAARECFDDKTEILTSTGWKLFSDLSEKDLIAQMNVDTKEISFAKPIDYIKRQYSGKLHYYKNKRTDICVTPEHRLFLINPHTKECQLTESSKGKWGRNFLYPVNGKVSGDNQLTTLERLLIAIQADGTLKYNNTSDLSRINDRSICFTLKKPRKIEKLISYLTDLGLNVNPLVRENGMTKFNFSLSGLVSDEIFGRIKDFNFFELDSLDTQKANQIIEEVLFWDGCVKNVLTYYNTNINAVNNIQAISVLSDYGCTKGINYNERVIKILNNKNDTQTKVCYRLTFTKENTRTYPNRVDVDYDGFVYCVTMPEGTLVTRRNGLVSIQGNCIHIAAYSHLMETLGFEDSVYNEFLKYKEMSDKHQFFNDMTETGKNNIVQQMCAVSAFTEGMQLFSSFVMLLNFGRNNLMPGMSKIVTWSVIDETLHCEGMIKLFRRFIQENRDVWNDELKSQLYTIAEKMVELEDGFINLAYGIMDGTEFSLPLHKEDMHVYIRFITDRRLLGLGLKPIFKQKKNPLPWVDEMLVLPSHSNFFEQEESSYAKGALTGTWGDVWGIGTPDK